MNLCPYMGEHPNSWGGRDLKIFEGGEYFGKKIFLGGIDFRPQRGDILDNSRPKFWNFLKISERILIWGGLFGYFAKKNFKGGEYFAKEYPSRRGGISNQNFSGGDILANSPPCAHVWYIWIIDE